MMAIDQDTLAVNSIGPTQRLIPTSTLREPPHWRQKLEARILSGPVARRKSAALSLITIVKVVTPPIVLVTLLDVVASAFSSDQETEECIRSDRPAQIGLNQFASLLHLLERAVDRLSMAIATVTGDLATVAIPALRLPCHYMVRVSLPSGRAHWSAAQLLLKSATQLLTPLSLSPSDGDENFVSFSDNG